MKTKLEYEADNARLVKEMEELHAGQEADWQSKVRARIEDIKKNEAALNVLADNESLSKDISALKEHYYKPQNPKVDLGKGAESKSGAERFSKEERNKIASIAFCEVMRGHAKSEAKAEAHARSVIRKKFGLSEEEAHQVINELERQSLSENDDSLGGSWVQPDFQMNRLVMNLPQISQIFGAVDVQPTSSNELVLPVVTPATGDDASIKSSDFAADWVSPEETEDNITEAETQDQPASGKVSIKVHKLQGKLVKIPQEFQEDSGVDVEGVIYKLIDSTLGLAIDRAIVNGSGIDQPLGILQALGSAQNKNSGAAGALTYEGLIRHRYALPPQYAGGPDVGYLMQSATYGEILLMQDGAGHFVFAPGQMGAGPGSTQPGMAVNALLNSRVYLSPYMPVVSAGLVPIVYGAWKQYCVADRRKMTVLVFREVFAPSIGIRPYMRLGGKPLVLDAFRKLTVAA